MSRAFYVGEDVSLSKGKKMNSRIIGGMDRKYDEACKRVFKNQEMIAPIFKMVVTEYKECMIEDVIRCIDEKTIQDIPIEDVPVKVEGLPTELLSVEDKLKLTIPAWKRYIPSGFVMRMFRWNFGKLETYTVLENKMVEKEVLVMTGLGASIMERGVRKGIEQGIEQERISVIRRMKEKGLSTEEIIILTNYTREEVFRVEKEMGRKTCRRMKRA